MKGLYGFHLCFPWTALENRMARFSSIRRFPMKTTLYIHCPRPSELPAVKCEYDACKADLWLAGANTQTLRQRCRQGHKAKGHESLRLQAPPQRVQASESDVNIGCWPFRCWAGVIS